MTGKRVRNLPNFYLFKVGESRKYKAPFSGTNKVTKREDWEQHSALLYYKIENAIKEGKQNIKNAMNNQEGLPPGLYLDFNLNKLGKGIDEFENLKKGVTIRNDKLDKNTITVFVPEEETDYFRKYADLYRKDEGNGLIKAREMLSRVENITLSSFESFISTKDLERIKDFDQIRWWELWLDKSLSQDFIDILQRKGFCISEEHLKFFDTDVYLIQASLRDLDGQILKSGGAICEIRLPSEQPSFYTENLSHPEQFQATQELISRIEVTKPFESIVQVIDTGVNYGHPLLKGYINEDHLSAVNKDWGITDSHSHGGHGTQMVSLVLFGDLYIPLNSSNSVVVSHAVGSVKILPPNGQNEKHLYGYLTQQAASIGEINAPQLKQVYCMAVTTEPVKDGKPSSWSMAVDNICYGDGGADGRVFLISAGNNTTLPPVNHTPQNNDSVHIEDPAQAWNAITVGGYTEKTSINQEDFKNCICLVEAGELSPHSTTSVQWDKEWPLKPDIVMEAGNLAQDSSGKNVVDLDDLSLIAASANIRHRYFTGFFGTSGATALAANLTVRLWKEKPEYWPQTIRGLLVHSAEWTPAMLKSFKKAKNKTDTIKLVRRYGMGVPSLERALSSLKNDLTIVYEDEIYPYKANESKKEAKLNQFKLFRLPWPKEVLEGLANETIELKVTLSYFIEPKRENSKIDRKHTYQSYGLKFDLKKPTQTEADFINTFERDEEYNGNDSSSSTNSREGGEWTIGPNGRKGSIHSDIWTGPAIALASCNLLGVKPDGGWWKYFKEEERWNKPVRFSLIITVRTKTINLDVDLYTPIETRLKTPIII